MHCIWKMNRGRVFSATAGRKSLTWLGKAQLAAHPRSEQFADIDGISWMQRSLVSCTPYFCRSFTGGIIEKSKDEIPQSKLKRLLAVCEGKPWDASIEEALGGYAKELTKTLVFKAVKNMEPNSAKGFFKWAGKQEGYKHATYLHNVLFRDFLQANKFECAIEVLQEMKENDIAIYPKSFTTLAQFYVKAGMMTEAEKTIEVMKSFGFSPIPKLYRILLGGYLQACDEEGADRLLQNFSGVEDFNVAISVYAAVGKPELALKVLDSMEKNNCLANVRTYELLVSCFSRANMIDEALKSLENMQEKGLLPHVNIYNTIVSHLLQENRVDEALKLVSNMKDNGCQPDSRTHHALIASYLNSGQTEKAQLQLEEMKMDGRVPTCETLKLFDAILGKSPHEELKDGKRDSKVKRILEICKGKSWDADTEEALSRYSKELSHTLVHKLLQSMEADLGKAFFRWAGNQEGYAHSKHEYNVLFRNFLYAGKFDSAVEILKEMKDKDMKFDTKCFASLVHFYGKAGMMREAAEAIDMMKSFGLNSDAKLYGVFLNVYLQANDEEGATSLLQDFSDVEDFNAAISAYDSAGKADSALKALEIMHQKGCPPNVQTYDLLVSCLCRAKMMEEAAKVLEDKQEKDLGPEVRVYNTLISYYCQKKRVDEALKLISKMKEFGCQPDITTHNSLITGYLKVSQVEKARQHVEEMKAEGCMPTPETLRLFVDKAMPVESEQKLSPDACKRLLKGLIKDGKLDEALKTFERMKEGRCHANVSTYIVLLRGCCNLCRFDVMDQLLAEVRTKNLQLPVSTFVVLLQTYSRAKKFKEVVALFEELQKSGQDCAGARTSTAVLDALSRAHQLDIGVKFCENIENSGAKVNARQVKYFFRLLIKAGRAGEATELMKAMAEKGCVIPEKSQLQAA